MSSSMHHVPAETGASRVDRRVGEFRARVLEAAQALFASNGVEATKIDDICEAADVARRTLCNHFPTKAHIVRALSREAVSRLVALIDHAREEGCTNHERVGLLFDGLVSRTLETGPVHRESVGAFFHVAHGTSGATEDELRLSAAIQALLEAGGANDLPPDTSIETFAELILGAIYSTTLEWIHREDYDLEARTAAHGAFLVGLLPVDPMNRNDKRAEQERHVR
ncbi:MAG: TetR/AcrR family transcriptional regulator [bacterium]|nr:TetR/AcrR family transcriptional regulator [bacterium]